MVLDHLKNVKAECYKIGTALHLKQGELDAIKRESADCAEAMIKIITSWLRKNYDLERFGEPTWKALVEAVANPIGGNNNALAMEIARSHSAPSSSSSGGTALSLRSPLTKKDHPQIVEYLKDLKNDELINVGSELGLHRTRYWDRVVSL